MAGRKKSQAELRKIVDDSIMIRSKSGQTGLVREEVWINQNDEIAKYNLAYINFHLFPRDNGRVLGYDNAHGYHERHYMGKAQEASFTTYEAVSNRFFSEVAKLRENA